MKYNYAVKSGGKYYPAYTEVPENTKKKLKGKEAKEDSEADKGLD